MHSPDRGIPREIMWLSDAVIVPPPGKRFRQEAGVLTAGGDPVPHGDNLCGRGLPLTTPPALPRKARRMQGNYLFAGNIRDHFGHAITEGIARLWALGQVRPDRLDGILVTPHDPSEVLGVLSLLQAMLAQLDVDLPITVLDRPVQVERLCVPGGAYNLGTLAVGTPEFRSLIRDRFAAKVAPGPHRKVWLSRSRLDPLDGGALNEADLEALLADGGYHVYHPQDHDLAHQIATLKGAEVIAGLEGSAFHLASLVPREGQRAFMIHRDQRTARFLRMMVRQYEAIQPGKSATAIHAFLGYHLPEDTKRSNRIGVATLDIAAILRTLQEADAIGRIEGAPDRRDYLKETERFLARKDEDWQLWRAGE